MRADGPYTSFGIEGHVSWTEVFGKGPGRDVGGRSRFDRGLSRRRPFRHDACRLGEICRYVWARRLGASGQVADQDTGHLFNCVFDSGQVCRRYPPELGLDHEIDTTSSSNTTRSGGSHGSSRVSTARGPSSGDPIRQSSIPSASRRVIMNWPDGSTLAHPRLKSL